MLLSRGTGALRALASLTKNKAQVKQIVRNHGDVAWSYRKSPPAPSKYYFVAAETISAVMWWWMLWHIWTEPDHILGEFEWPDTSKWTDQELGIPDDLEIESE